MRIGLVLNSTPGYSETFFRNLVRVLTERGHHVTLFVDRGDEVPDLPDLRIGFAWGGPTLKGIARLIAAFVLLIASPLRTLRLFKQNREDGFVFYANVLSLLKSSHIIGTNLDWLHFGFATVALGRENLGMAMNARVAVSIRGYDMAVFPLKHPGCYELLWKRSERLHYLSQDLLRRAELTGLKEETVRMHIPPAIDLSEFSNRSFRGLGEKLRIITVGRLHWVKGYEYVLEALAMLTSRGIEFQYTVVGDGEDLERLVFACHQLGIEKQVKFVGKLTPLEVREELARNDVYVQYSVHEGFCNALIEARAAGLLCVGSDAGAIPENIDAERTGWIVPRRNPTKLAETIMELLTKPVDELAAVSAAAVASVRGTYDLSAYGDRFNTFYESAKSENS